jgi:hypothetical protein
MSERVAPAAVLLALLVLAGCTNGPGPSSVRLPGGPMRGTMTWDEAMSARTGLTTLDRVPEPAGR